MTAQQAPQPLTVPELLEVLVALGAPATVPANLDDADAVLHLSHGLVGAAERKAMEAGLAVRVNGADSPKIISAIEEAYAAANAQNRLDVLAHVQWRATRLVQALQALLADMGRDDKIKCQQTVVCRRARYAGTRLLSAVFRTPRGFLGNPEIPSSFTGPARYQFCCGDQGQHGGLRETLTRRNPRDVARLAGPPAAPSSLTRSRSPGHGVQQQYGARRPLTLVWPRWGWVVFVSGWWPC